MSNDTISIPLSKTGSRAGKYTATVSIEDDVLADFNWTVSIAKHHKTEYAIRRQGSKRVKMHRAVMARMLERELLPTEQVDHIDMNGLNNTRDNLRLVTPFEQAQNKSLYKNNSSGTRGITWNKQHNQWLARIQVNGKRIFLGLFKDLEDAQKAYHDAKSIYHIK